MNTFETVQPSAEASAGYEAARLRALQDLDLLDTPASEGFDRITRMASRVFNTPISAVSLTDRTRQWFKSHVGTGGREIPREGAPCAEVTRSKNLLVIPDLLLDSRFETCILAQSGVRFYAGAPLATRNGYVLGSMCVLDKEPRNVTADEISALQDFASMVTAQIELQHDFGRVDFLSGFPNRTQLSDDLDDLQNDGLRNDGAATGGVLVLVDLVSPRQLNEITSVLGTAYLDSLVHAASKILKDTLGRKTGLYHVGHTSFAVLLNNATDESWWELVDRLAASLKEPFDCNSIPVSIDAVFGISPFGLSDASCKDALRTAVSAAHDARETEIDRAVYSAANDEANQRRYVILTEIKKALRQPEDLSLVYQPRLDLHTDECSSAEALLRWQNPRLGNVPPGEFIPLIEQTALVPPATEWVINTALKQISSWRSDGLAMRVSLNVSALDFGSRDFAERLARAMSRHKVVPNSIELEFTESALIRNRTQVLAQLAEIRAMGVELAIDDFGTGYSAFSYLQKLPASTVKLDQSFMGTLSENARDRTLVRSMISMAHDLGYRVVAEGVETRQVLDFLQDSGCDEIQGYFICRPIPPVAFARWIHENGGAGSARQAS